MPPRRFQRPADEQSQQAIDQSYDQQMLACVDPRMVDVLGNEWVIEVETGSLAVEWLDSLSRHPNPFSEDQAEADVSSLKTKDQIFLAEAGILTGDTEFTREYIAGLGPVRRALLDVRLRRSSKTLIESWDEQLKESGQALDDAFDRIESMENELHSSPLSFSQIANEANNMLQIAGSVPREKTTTILNAILDARISAISSNQRLSDDIGNNISSKLIKFGSSERQHDISRIQRVINSRAKLLQAHRNAGKITFEYFRDAILNKVKGNALEVFSRDLSRAKSVLGLAAREQDGPSHESIVIAEGYLKDKSDDLRSFLKNLNPGLTKDQHNQALFRRLGSTPFSTESRRAAARAERQQSQQERRHRLEAAQNLSVRVSEAKDIIVGGRRLKNESKNGHRKRDNGNEAKADALHAITTGPPGQPRLLSPDQRGIIMAVLTDKFDVFVNTLEEVKASQSPTEIVRTLETERPGAIKDLREFDIDVTLEKLAKILANPELKVLLTKVLKFADVIKVESAIAKHLDSVSSQSDWNKGVAATYEVFSDVLNG